MNTFWHAALGELELQMPRATFETWLKGTCVLAYKPADPPNKEDAHLVVGTQNAYAKDWLENRLQGKVRQTVAGVLGHPVEVSFRVRQRSKGVDESPQLLQGLPDDTPATPPPTTDGGGNTHWNGKGNSYTHLNPRYTFERFIVGTGNRLAHAAALSIAEHPAERPYNPLFIYGGVGLGKTHLLHAAGHLPAAQGLRVRVVSSEQFTNDLITAIRTQTTGAFREKYRDLDVLLIDDIQFIAGKERIQEEVFHTFNTLHSASKQIVLTSDRHPKGLTTLEERLRSRFEWGLTADIQPPDLETRIAILQSKAEHQPVPIPLGVLEIIAHQIESNIRELEGALNRIVMYTRCMNLPITIDTAARALADILAAKPEPPSVPVILEIVAGFYDLEVDDLLGRSRSRRIALPRQIAMYVLREEVGLSFPQIGAEMGGRDHSTVMHAHQKITVLTAQDDSLRRAIMAIKQRMYQRLDD
ncbi:MAG: chromosomal replication initiator protein DnaA [Anaerolineae bacterium]